MIRRSILTTCSIFSLIASFVLGSTAASASETKADPPWPVDYCGAYNHGSESADVPSENQYKYYKSVMPDNGEIEELLCGNGHTWGAVHIGTKHNVSDWSVTLDCMANIIDRGNYELDNNGKRQWHFVWSAGRWAHLTAGDNGILTSFTYDNEEGSWSECAYA